MRVAHSPVGVAITPSGAFAYVVNQDSNTVSVIATATNTVVATVPVGDSPTSVAVTPNGASAYVTNYLVNTVSVISTATNTVVATVPVGNAPGTVAIMPNGAFAYVTSNFSHNLTMIATATNTVVGTVPIGIASTSVAIMPDGTFAYVVWQDIDTVSVIAIATNTVVATVPVGIGPATVAITPNGAFAYVPNAFDNTVSVIATATNTVVATVPVGNGPAGVAITPSGAFAYVTNSGEKTVSVIATATNTVVATILVGNVPNSIAIMPSGAFAYVTNFGDNTVSVIAIPVTGVCGSANGVASTVAPSANLCSAGTASAVTGTGPWSWMCNGVNGGSNASCSAPMATYVVTPNAGANGSISPSTPQTVNAGATATFRVTPANGYTASVSGCGGTLTGNTYTTAPITANCNVTASFSNTSATNVNLDQHGLSGSWGRSNAPGTRQGFLFNFYPDIVAAGHGTVFAGWYTYDVAGGSGGQRWYALQGDIYNNISSASLGIYTSVDGDLSSGSRPVNSQVGTATLSFSDCSTGMLVYAFNDGRSGSIPLSRVSHSTANCSASGDTSVDAQNYLLSGAWGVPNTIGMGFVIDVSPADKVLLGSWYTFFPTGNSAPSPRQQWFVFQDSNFSPTQTSSSNIALLQASGGTFDATLGGGITTAVVGKVSLTFTSCTTATLTYAISTESVSQNTVDLVRIGPAPAGCALP